MVGRSPCHLGGCRGCPGWGGWEQGLSSSWASLTSSCLPRFPDGFEKFSPPILQLDEVDFYYDPSHYIFCSLSVSADLESRICVVCGIAE